MLEKLQNLSFTTMLSIVVLLFATLFFCTIEGKHDPIPATVAITTLAMTSGGTGVVVKSHKSYSTILTNSHVCRLIVSNGGGVVTTQRGEELLVNGYKMDVDHDLCLIKVNHNLGINTVVASHAPTPYYEHATISGHPSLYPTVLTQGHFSGFAMVPVATGIEPCTPKEEQDNPFVCLLLGGKPIIKIYESQLVSATIMAGSSGSAVYNEHGELSNLVFAGSGGLSYAWTVPYYAVRSFLDNSVKKEWINMPVPNLQAPTPTSDDHKAAFDKLREACKNPVNRNKLGLLCRVQSDLIWRDNDDNN